MNAFQLRILIYDLYCNDNKLRELSKSGVISSKDLYDWQDKVVELAKKDYLLDE